MTDELNEQELGILRGELKRLEDGNNASYTQLCQTIPSFQMDTTAARLQCLVDALTATVWTEGDRLTFELAFHTRVEDALKGAWEKVREAKAKEQLIKPPSSGKLFGPGGRPLN